jgi:acyl-CoA synthetase (AMP-forming)/AMP-acid ligase II
VPGGEEGIRPVIVGDIYQRNARLNPNGTALVFEGRRFTHAEFLARSHRLANALCGRGLTRQDRVAVLAQNCSQYLEAFAAAHITGFILCPLNYRLAVPELRGIAADCQPTAILFERQYAAVAAALREALPEVALWIQIDGDSDDWLSYEALLAGAAATPPPLRARPSDTAHLLYTSGTTGRPKGVMLGQRQFLQSALAIAADGVALPTDVTLIVMPLYHLGAEIESFAWVTRGAPIVLHRAFDAGAALRDIAAERVSAAHLAPLMVQRILEHPDFATTDRSSLRAIHYASAPMPVPLLRRAIAACGPIFSQVYGMTECIILTMLKPHQHLPDGSEAESRRLASAGQEMLGVEIRVVRGDGSECAVEEVGEVQVRSPGLMNGYWNNTAATLAVSHDGWMMTGDMAFFDAERFLFIADRKKDMIVSGGENIYSREVEEALLLHPAVAEAAVIGVPDREWGESVMAFVVLAPGAEQDPTTLIDHCRSRIAGYKKPRSIEFVEALPRLFNGKIDKKALRAPYWHGQDRQVS